MTMCTHRHVRALAAPRLLGPAHRFSQYVIWQRGVGKPAVIVARDDALPLKAIYQPPVLIRQPLRVCGLQHTRQRGLAGRVETQDLQVCQIWSMYAVLCVSKHQAHLCTVNGRIEA